MKKFRFKLQKLLDIRLKKEDMAKENFARALQKYEQEKDNLAKTSSAIEVEKNTHKQRRATAAVNAIAEQQYQSYLKSLLYNMTRGNLQLNMARNVLDQKRAELVQAQKDRKIIEELREKQFTEYRLAADKEENKVIDEIGTMAAARENEFVMKGF